MTIPAITATAPPAINHMERSLGLPEKNRETSELKECDSLKPKINKTMPSAKIASPTMFMPERRIAADAGHWGLHLKSYEPATCSSGGTTVLDFATESPVGFLSTRAFGTS